MNRKIPVIASVFTVIWVVFWALFAGVSGASGGFSGIVKNLPNMAPWILPMMALFIARKYPMAGGILFLGFAVFSALFFHTTESLLTFAIITGPALISSILFFIVALGKNKSRLRKS